MKKLVLGAFALALGVFLLAGPNTAGAQTATSCFVFNNDLSYGMTFGEVLELQKFLAADGSFTVELTGTFGPLTRAALAQYQSKNGILATGYFGPATRAFVNAAGCGQVLGAYDQVAATAIPKTTTTTERSTTTGTKTVSETIKLVTPYEGTTWQIGNSHTIAWTPDRENPNVKAYFETKKGGAYTKFAEIIACQKGSIIWCGDIDTTPTDGVDNWSSAKPGKYFVSIVDTVTGSIARTKNEIKLVPLGDVVKLDMTAHLEKNKKVKIEGELKNTLTVKERKVVLSWAANADSCNLSIQGDEMSDFETYNDLKRHVTKQSFNLPGNYKDYFVILNCQKGSNYQIKSFVATVEGAIDQGNLNFSRSSFDYTYVAGSPNEFPVDQLIINNESSKIINITLRVPNQPAWLNTGYATEPLPVSPGSPMGVGVYINPAGLVAGDYRTELIISGDFKNSPKIIPITLKVEGDTVQPSIKVLGPNGGERFTKGEMIKIDWEHGNLPPKNFGIKIHNEDTPGSSAQIRFCDSSDYYQDNYPNQNHFWFNWKVGYNAQGEELKDGNYRIEVYHCDDTVVTKDVSDKPFTIGNISAPYCPLTFVRDLTLGSTGSDVVKLQTFLEAKGFLTLPAGVSKGYFGASTQTALAQYQNTVGIAPADGYFGPLVRAYMAANECKPPTTVTDPLTVNDIEVDSDSEDGIGTFTFEIELTAGDEDVYIPVKSVGPSDNVGFDWRVVGGTSAPVTVISVQSDAEIDSGYYPEDQYYGIQEGDTETFTVVVTVDAASTGAYYVILDDVSFFEDIYSNPIQTFKFQPASDFDTPAVSIIAMGPQSAPAARVAANTSSYSHISLIPNLSVGMTDAGVITIQRFLNANGFQVSAAGQPGSVGYESSYFGAATQAALAKYQASKGISPANGSFGPVTRVAMSQ